ncbi:hypothetical protein Tco_0026356 [Tanacetum coccineum]
MKNHETLKKQCDDLIVKLNQTEFTAATYKRGLATVEEQLITYRKNEVLFSEEVAVLKREVACKDYEINVLKSECEKFKQEKDGIEFKIEKFDKASKDLDQLLGSQITDKKEFQEPEFEGYGPKTSKSASKDISNEVRKSNDAPLIEKTNRVNAVKASACWVWRPIKPNSASITLKRYDYVDGNPKTELEDSVMLNSLKDKKYKVNADEGVNAAIEEVSTAELVSTAYVIYINDLKVQLQDKTLVINELKHRLAQLHGKSPVTQCESPNFDSRILKIEDENVSLAFHVSFLVKEREHIKLEYKKLYDSIKQTRAKTTLQTDSLQQKLNDQTSENIKLRAQLKAKFSEPQMNKKGSSVNTKLSKPLMTSVDPTLIDRIPYACLRFSYIR